ncbi:hypothetical protein C1645_504036 [Glomus cerebriforme]|uniref:Cupredoxin n=1 Tax=Glomus cerebriforme TaxID=658196 RepID=A0A397S8Z3_9GLOM|nr:hypothetical protein C1645_504036 [Glomus cerebriforme]
MKSFIWLYIIFIYFINGINCETIVVTVGERGLYFTPQNITARVNDIIKWEFLNGKHQIIQSDGPAGSCSKSNNQPFMSILQEGGEFTYQIPQTTGTIYYFCGYSSHCSYGMWGTISIDTSTTAITSQDNSPSPTTPVYTGGGGVDNLPIIIGSSIGGFFALAIIGLIIFMLYRRNKYQKQFEVAMQPYDPKLNVENGGNGRINHLSNMSASVTTLDNNNANLLSRSNTYNRDDHSTNEVVSQDFQQNDETIRERTSSEHGGASIIRGSSKKDLSYKYNSVNSFNIDPYGERSRSPLSPPPTYNPTQNTTYNPYDNEILQQQQQQQLLLQQQQQQQQQRQSTLPRPPPPPPSQPPPPPNQQQTVYTIDPAQYYGLNNPDN